MRKNKLAERPAMTEHSDPVLLPTLATYRSSSLYLAGMLLCMAFALGACDSKTPVAQEAPRPVRTLVLQIQEIDVIGQFPAEIRPRIESALGFRVGGKIIERMVQAGQEVKPGQVLARLDAADLKLNEDASRAQLAAAQAEQQQTRADLKRYTELRDRGFISAAQYDARKAAADAAQARYEQARASVAVQANQAQYAALIANAEGVVTAVDAEVGQVVAAGQAVFRVAGSNAKEAAFQVPENRVDQVRRAGLAEVELWAGGPILQGKVREIAASADALTRAFAVRVSLIDPPPTVQFGMTATVRFTARRTDALPTVPLSALLHEQNQTWVWLFTAETSKVHRVPVKVLTVGDSVAVLEGVQAGAEVVTAGAHMLREGQTVKRLESESRPASAQGVARTVVTPGVLEASGARR